jgi:hypothetical protein
LALTAFVPGSSMSGIESIASALAEPASRSTQRSSSKLHAILDFSRNMATIMQETAYEEGTALAVAGPCNKFLSI